ncbi:hypothetical protein LCGC14_2472240, partial [marine sediment metagenome]
CTTICEGVRNLKNPDKASICQFCYKSNNPNGRNLSFENFKTMIDKLPRLLTQIAFGCDSRAESNPDLFKMMKYCREIGVIPNITVADISDDIARQLCEVCGAVAVSRYEDKNICYDSVKKLTDGGLDQVNVHCLLSENSFDWCMETAKDKLSDPRLAKLNAIVFLSLKKKGRAKNGFESVSYEKFRELFLWCLQNNVSIGFDSCSAPRFMQMVKDEESIEENIRKQYLQCCEPCESGLFSFYTGVDSCYYPCSFAEKEKGWEDGLSLLGCSNFFKDIWYHPKNVKWRNSLIRSGCDGCRKCLIFPEINEIK